jgi:hypothetical protein
MIWRVLLCAVTVVLGQIPAERQQRMRLAEANPTPSSMELQAVRSDRLTRALRSPDDLWAFVTLPEPMYLERRAAAYQAKGLVPVTWLPKIWRAIGELRREQAASEFGLKSHPMSATVYMPQRPRREGPRQILGHPWVPPAQPLDYPLTPKERERAPWPWQVQEALSDLTGVLVPSTYAPLEREKADAYLAAVLTMPCSTDEEATWLISAVQGSSHYKTPAIMATLLNIALNPRLPLAAVQVGTTYADATRMWNDPRSWDLGATGLLEILRNSPHPEGRRSAAYGAKSLREAFASGRTTSRPVPAAVILELSRLALDPAAGDEWTRLYVYAFSVVEALDEKPFPPDRRMDPASPDVQRRLKDFAGWLADHQRDLATLAAAQQPAIDAAARLLAQTATCRAG